jgi:hypothetical protein
MASRAKQGDRNIPKEILSVHTARILQPELQEKPKEILRREGKNFNGKGNIMSLMQQKSEVPDSCITQCSRKHNAKFYEDTVLLKHAPTPTVQMPVSTRGRKNVAINNPDENPKVSRKGYLFSWLKQANRASTAMKQLNDFRSAITTLPGNMTIRPESKEGANANLKVQRLGRNLMTTYERVGATAHDYKLDQKKAQVEYSQIPYTGRRMYRETWKNLYGESKENKDNVLIIYIIQI